jgi:hypothetical protein
MGGKALKNCETKRYPAHLYYPLEAEVLARLRRDFPERRVETIRSYRAKTDFGDMDVLLESDGLAVDVIDYLREAFDSQEVVQNSNVYSFEFQGFQVDLILTPTLIYQTSANYFAWNDLGNLLGRVAHSTGMSLGHDGLRFSFRDGDYLFDQRVITKDWEVALTALGYNYERWSAGFDTLDDLFRFAASSAFFNRDIYLLHNRNYRSRTRDAKRKTYMKFLRWLELQPEDFMPAYPRLEHKNEWLPYLFTRLPGFEQYYVSTKAALEAQQAFKARFNGERVMALTSLREKALGRLMERLRAHFGGPEGLREWVRVTADPDIDRFVLSFADALE